MHPRVRRVRADELEAERADAVLARVLDRRQLRAGHPKRRMRLLPRLRQYISRRKVEMRSVVFHAAVLEHRNDAADRVFEDRALAFHRDAEGLELGDARALAHAELDATVAQEIEYGDAFGDFRRMTRRQLNDAVTQANVLRSLARGAQENFRRRRMRIFF